MYRILMRQGWDGTETVVHSAVGSARRALSCKLSLSVDAYPTMTLSIDPTNPAFGNVNPFTTFFRVIRIDNQRVLFEGRALTYQPAMATDGSITEEVTAVGLEDLLHDSVQPWAEFHNTTPQAFLQKLIDNHNAQVEPYKQITLGTVTVTNSTDNVYRYTDDSKDTYDTINDKLIASLGGEIRVRNEGGKLLLDYEPEIAATSTQNIRLRSNMLSLTRKVDPSAVVSVLKPLGKAADQTTSSNSGDTTTETSTPRLTIASVNGGSEFLRDDDLVASYGVQTGAVTWDDVTEPANLLTKGKTWLQTQAAATEQIQITAVDLSMVGKVADDFFCGNYYPITNELLQYYATRRIVSQHLDICSPLQSTMTAGDVVMTLESYTKQLQSEAIAASDIAKLSKARMAATEETLKNLQATVDGLTKPAYYEGNIIDVSEFQGTIDWQQVTGAGLALAVIRVQSGASHEDATYKANISAAISAGVNYGVYAYFAALDATDAAAEAQSFYERTTAAVGSQRAPRLWMIDVEEATVTSGTMRSAVSAYMDKLNALGIPDSKIVLYIANQLYDSFDLDVVRTAAVWIPSYGSNDGTVAGSSKPTHSYDLWQYTSKGVVAGITANTVDLSADPSDRFKAAFLTK